MRRICLLLRPHQGWWLWERVGDKGPCSHAFILGTLAKLHFPTPRWAASPWGGPVPTHGWQRSCALTKTCSGLGSTFPCAFPPSTILSLHHLGTVLVPEGLCPLLPMLQDSGMCRKLHTSQTLLGRLKRLKELICNMSGQQCWYFLFCCFLLQDDFALKAPQHLADSYWRCFISQEWCWTHLGSSCTHINTLPLPDTVPTVNLDFVTSFPVHYSHLNHQLGTEPTDGQLHLYSAAADNLQGTSRHE